MTVVVFLKKPPPHAGHAHLSPEVQAAQEAKMEARRRKGLPEKKPIAGENRHYYA